MKRRASQNSVDTRRGSRSNAALIVLLLVALAVIGALSGLLFIDVFSPDQRTAPDQAPQEVVTDPAPHPNVLASSYAQVSGCIKTSSESHPVTLYLADTPELRQKGLKGVRGLPDNHGMIFSYDSVQPSDTAFWMHNTPIDLDIALLDSYGKILSIRMMKSCSGPASSCERHPAGSRFLAAVEFPAGFFRQKGVTVGDSISAGIFDSCS
jgi:uncharacterized membrane protein (UPF0127 family)